MIIILSKKNQTRIGHIIWISGYFAILVDSILLLPFKTYSSNRFFITIDFPLEETLGDIFSKPFPNRLLLANELPVVDFSTGYLPAKIFEFQATKSGAQKKLSWWRLLSNLQNTNKCGALKICILVVHKSQFATISILKRKQTGINAS